MKTNEHGWNIGLSSWVLLDNGEPDVYVGQTRRFAVECVIRDPRMVIGSAPILAEHVTDSIYDVQGVVVYVNERMWVLDIGFLSRVHSDPPRGIAVGRIVRGRGFVEVDADQPQEEDSTEPPSVYAWRIAEITVDTTPLLEFRKEGRRYFERDKSRRSFERVRSTSAETDHPLMGDYVLGCELMPDAPTHVA